MSSFNHSSKDIELSIDAINFLSRQFVNDCEKKIINENFIFQIEFCTKNLDNWYSCCLIDKNSKNRRFYIQYEEKSGIPKEGDIIETNIIHIVKVPNISQYLYFCENVKKLSEGKKIMKIDSKRDKNINSDKIKQNNVINMDNNNKNSNNNFKYDSFNKNNIEQKDNKLIYIESNKINKEYTLIKDINKVENPIFYVKCKSKTGIKDCKNKLSKSDGKMQYYYFLDTEGETLRLAAFGMANINYFNSLIQFGGVYELSQLIIQKNNNEYSNVYPFNIIITKNTSNVKKLKDKGDFVKIKDIIEKIITKIKDLNSSKQKYFLDVVGIVLEDKGFEKNPNSRILIVGDNTLHRINVKLWNSAIDPKREFSKGDIIYMSDIVYRETYIFSELTTLTSSQVFLCQPSPIEEELRNFYKIHPNIYEYMDMNLIYLNANKDIELRFISDFRKESKPVIEKEKKELNFNMVKLCACIINVFHQKSNIIKKCVFCNKKVEEDICPNCGRAPKLFAKLTLEIKDSSGHLFIDLLDLKLESFIKMTSEEYMKIINDNNEEKIEEINRRILYKKYVFYGKYQPSFKGCYGFSVYKSWEIDDNFYKSLIQKLKYYLKL